MKDMSRIYLAKSLTFSGKLKVDFWGPPAPHSSQLPNSAENQHFPPFELMLSILILLHIPAILPQFPHGRQIFLIKEGVETSKVNNV